VIRNKHLFEWLAFCYCYGNALHKYAKNYGFLQLTVVGAVDIDIGYEANELGSIPHYAYLSLFFSKLWNKIYLL